MEKEIKIIILVQKKKERRKRKNPYIGEVKKKFMENVYYDNYGSVLIPTPMDNGKCIH